MRAAIKSRTGHSSAPFLSRLSAADISNGSVVSRNFSDTSLNRSFWASDNGSGFDSRGSPDAENCINSNGSWIVNE